MARESVSHSADHVRDERWHAWEQGMRASEARLKRRGIQSAALLCVVIWLLLLIR